MGSDPTLSGASPLAIVTTDGASLYEFDPVAARFSAPRALRGCHLPIVELTRRDDGELFAAGFRDGIGALYRVREDVCTETARFAVGSPWAVAFLPPTSGGAGTLIGDEGGRLVALDVLGARTEILKRPNVGQVTGDLVVTSDGDGWVTLEGVFDGAITLQRIDPRTGATRATYTVATTDPIEGLVEDRGALLGFTRQGRVVDLHIEGATVGVEPRAVSGAPTRFTGAAAAWSGGAPR